jgi:ribonuclease PH
MNIVMTGAGAFVELQATAEKLAFGDDRLAELLTLGRQGVKELIAAQEKVLAS